MWFQKYLSLLWLCNDDLAGLDGGGCLSAGLLGLLCALHLYSSWLLGQSEVVLYRLCRSCRLTHLLLKITRVVLTAITPFNLQELSLEV